MLHHLSSLKTLHGVSVILKTQDVELLSLEGPGSYFSILGGPEITICLCLNKGTYICTSSSLLCLELCPTEDVQVLNPSTCECDLIWKQPLQTIK